MSYRTDVGYIYDGTFDGFLSCVFESYDKKELPFSIESEELSQPVFFRVRHIVTDPEKARRVFLSIPEKICPEALELTEKAFLTCLPQKEVWMLKYLRLGFYVGSRITGMLAQESVHMLTKAVLQMSNETHLLLGFTRFSDYNGALVAVIEPKNCVLPLMQAHFCSRYPRERFMIYDRTHKLALIHQPASLRPSPGAPALGQAAVVKDLSAVPGQYLCDAAPPQCGQTQILQVDSFEEPPADVKEEQCRQLWRKFYDTIAIEGRINPRCRMTHMPKRYWPVMTEVKDR